MSLVAGLFVDFGVVNRNEMKLKRAVDEYGRMCKGKKLKVNAGKSKVTVLRERKRAGY